MAKSTTKPHGATSYKDTAFGIISRSKLLKLTLKQRDQLWGENGPYSEACLILETRILDDFVSRIFINVEIHINPFTYKIIKKHRKVFIDDPLIQQLRSEEHTSELQSP